nr:hypothetical protein Iba_chr10bCG13430 [Ipomoea batatas]
METDGGNVVRKKQKLVAKSTKKMIGGTNVEGGIERGVHNVGLIELVFRCEHGESRGNVALREDDPLIVLKETALLTLNVGLLNLLEENDMKIGLIILCPSCGTPGPERLKEGRLGLGLTGGTVTTRLAFSRSRAPSVGDFVPRDVYVADNDMEIVDHPLPVFLEHQAKLFVKGIEQTHKYRSYDQPQMGSSSSGFLFLEKSNPVITSSGLNLTRASLFTPSTSILMTIIHRKHFTPSPQLGVTVGIYQGKALESRLGKAKASSCVNNGKPSSTISLAVILSCKQLGLHTSIRILEIFGDICLNNSDEDTNLPRLFEIVWLL